MKFGTRVSGLVCFVIASAFLTCAVYAQGGPGRGRGPGFRGGHGPDDQFFADRDDFHFLLSNHEKISRKVTNTKQGVETITESDDPDVVKRLRRHVRAMYRRVDQGKAIRMHDPLFVEIFRNADKIEMKFEDTKKGIRVTETSADPYVATLIQEHAKVVSAFVKSGFDEAHKNHPLPGKTLTAEEALAGCKGGKEGGKGCCQDGAGTDPKSKGKACGKKKGKAGCCGGSNKGKGKSESAGKGKDCGKGKACCSQAKPGSKETTGTTPPKLD